MKNKKIKKIESVFLGIIMISIFAGFLFIGVGALFLLFATQQTFLYVPLILGFVISGYSWIIKKKIIKIFYLDVWWRALDIKGSNPDNDLSIYTPTIYDQMI